MPSYYNEFDPYAAQWLRNLIAKNLIAPGDVDERSIVDVHPDDLRGYTQCHFFAGIGGWSLALRMAGWDDTRPVWTGSCPCQPFSSAGKQLGTADARHLWPQFFRLIAQCRPATVFGEQVASRAGREWLARVFADVEGVGYAAAGADLCAAGAGAPHIRQRLYWVADATGERCAREHALLRSESAGRIAPDFLEAAGRSAASGMGDADGARPQGWRERGHGTDQWPSWSSGVAIPCADGKSRRIEPGIQPLANGVPARMVRLRGYGNAIVVPLAATFIKAVA